MSEKNQDAFDELQALGKATLYRNEVAEIHDSLCKIRHGLQQYNQNTGHKKEPWARLLKTDFEYLEASTSQTLLNEIKIFKQLFEHYKAEYEAEVLTEVEV